jgi:hypothetical protein
MKIDCAIIDKNLDRCTCTYVACSRKGICCECIAHHRKKNEIPGCLFPEDAEKEYDRSIARFIEAVRGRGDKG